MASRLHLSQHIPVRLRLTLVVVAALLLVPSSVSAWVSLPQKTSSKTKNTVLSSSAEDYLMSKDLVIGAIASAAVVSSVISFRRQRQIEKECDALQRELIELRRETNNEKSIEIIETNASREEEIVIAEETKKSEKSSRSLFPPRPTLEFDEGRLLVKPIGTIRSIYRLCVGTPRQGLLAPNARGCIELLKLGDSSPAYSVVGLEGYSHVWVIFVFHLNTQSKNATKIKSKIAPPALGGEKVGIFATRTPHRFNPIGITLCKLDRVQAEKGDKVTLHISGLDLVDGTPVLDIKPYVPIYDSVEQDVKLPPWVTGGLATKREVRITNEARYELQRLLEEDPHALQFYGPSQGDKTTEDTLNYALECIRQVLAIDVRSSYQTKKAREGKSQAERAERVKSNNVKGNYNAMASDVCTQQLDNLLIYYKVEEGSDRKRSNSENSGAEDMLSVISIQLLSR
jgi:tRNA-Thr(GGU) m(6)t(6)A37 methyltransferase TsaA